MSEKNFGISLNTMFTHDGCSCFCDMDTQYEHPGEPPTITLKVCPDTSMPLLFSYSPKDGLNLTGKAGGVQEKNILGKLLAIEKNNLPQYINFIEEYGFLYRLPEMEYTAVDAIALIETINRIKATINLYNCINKRNYKGTLIHIAYLLFSPVINIQVGETTYSSCFHEFKHLIDTYNLFPDLNREPEVCVNGTYSVYDSFLEKNNAIDIEFYNAVRSGSDTTLHGSRDPQFKNLMAVYVGCRNLDDETRFLIDFFYNLQTNVSIIKEASFCEMKTYTKLSEDGLDDKFKKALLRAARIVVATEINHNIQGIHPKYNGGHLAAIWQVNSLIEALYFSVFYMRNGEMYKECENPNCKRDKYFLVETTRTNKHYCCIKCRNAASAQPFKSKKDSTCGYVESLIFL